MNIKCIQVYVFFFLYHLSLGLLSEYFRSVGAYFGYSAQSELQLEDDTYNVRVLYEVSAADDKFISEAVKLTGVALSELDSCQHRVVLKLQTACHKMNDEQVAKMAVMLLNCQSIVEGRRIYPCTDDMSIKDCTISMDADTWNSYHLMSNRARAVCFSIKQAQFRGLTEHTINRLMETSHNQVFVLGKLAKDQENLHDVAQKTLHTVTEGQETLAAQQKDLQKAQFFGQLVLEDNIKRLGDEKRLISESHEQLASMTHSVQTKLEEAAKQLDEQVGESRDNHLELLDDLVAIQNKAQIIFQRIEDSSNLLIQQSEVARLQYEATLQQLAEVNKTVHALVAMVGGTRQALEDRLSWLTTALGGTDLAVERLYIILWHVAFLLTSMVCSSFLGAATSTRLAVAALPTLNVAIAFHGKHNALDPVSLAAFLAVFITVQYVLLSIISLYRTDVPDGALLRIKEKLKGSTRNESVVIKDTAPVEVDNFTSPNLVHEEFNYKSSHLRQLYTTHETDSADEYQSLTPPPSRNECYNTKSRSRTPVPYLNGSVKNICHAKTRQGTPCKLRSIPGRECCYRHQSGDSVMGT